MPSANATPWRSSSMRDTRSRVIAICNEERVPVAARQRILNEVAELEHLLHVAEEAAVEAENRRRTAAARVAGQAELLEGLEHVLQDERHAEVARRALGMLERELPRSA